MFSDIALMSTGVSDTIILNGVAVKASNTTLIVTVPVEDPINLSPETRTTDGLSDEIEASHMKENPFLKN